MKIHFYKYHGAGNDFIAIDNRNPQSFSFEIIKALCDRHLGIGADGVLLLGPGSEQFDFTLDYYNSDGHIGSLCGNGSRCAVAFAHHLQMIQNKAVFKAFDGLHYGDYISDQDVSVTMNDVNTISFLEDGYVVDTGSPHFVTYIDDIHNYDVYNVGKKIRNDIRFPDGINVNFVSPIQDGIFVRTFERGVENETLSCGTGVTACAIVHTINQNHPDGAYRVKLYTTGGEFTVSLSKNGTHFSNIILQGPTQLVFEGSIEI